MRSRPVATIFVMNVGVTHFQLNHTTSDGRTRFGKVRPVCHKGCRKVRPARKSGTITPLEECSTRLAVAGAVVACSPTVIVPGSYAATFFQACRCEDEKQQDTDQWKRCVVATQTEATNAHNLWNTFWQRGCKKTIAPWGRRNLGPSWCCYRQAVKATENNV